MLFFYVGPLLFGIGFQCGLECAWEREAGRFRSTSSAKPGADAANVKLTAAVDLGLVLPIFRFEFVLRLVAGSSNAS